MAKPRSRLQNITKNKSSLNLVIDDKEPRSSIHGVVVGRLIGFQKNGLPLVAYPQSPNRSVATRSTLSLSEKYTGREVALMFESGDATKPIIMGLMEPPPPKVQLVPEESAKESLDVHVDGERIEFAANKEIVLKCGKATVTLTRAGKIILRGVYLLSRSTGANRIKGGSVQIN